MVTEKRGMYCLNSSLKRNTEDKQEKKPAPFCDVEHAGAEIVTRIDNVDLTDEQAAKIKAIHDRHAAEINAVLGW